MRKILFLLFGFQTLAWGGVHVMQGDSIMASSITVTGLGIAINGSGAGKINLTEGAVPSGVASSHDLLWADSTSHALLFNPNNTSNYTVVGSSTTPTNGHLASWSGQGTLIDGGEAGGGGSGNAVLASTQTWTGTNYFSNPVFVSTATGGGAQASNILINTAPSAYAGNDNVAIGRQAGNACTTCNSNVIIGTQAGLRIINETNDVLIGYQAGATLQDTSNNANNTAIGQLAIFNTSDTINTTAIGRAALYNNIHGTGSTALGKGACQNVAGIDVSNAICIGADSRVDTNGTMAIGSVSEPITDVYMNSINPALTVNGNSINFHAQDSSGTDKNGGNFTIMGGRSSGNGTAGDIIVQASTASAGTSALQNSLVTVGTFAYPGIALPSYTKGQISAIKPKYQFQLIGCSDCTALTMCVSTGTAVAGSWSSPTSKTTACN